MKKFFLYLFFIVWGLIGVGDVLSSLIFVPGYVKISTFERVYGINKGIGYVYFTGKGIPIDIKVRKYLEEKDKIYIDDGDSFQIFSQKNT